MTLYYCAATPGTWPRLVAEVEAVLGGRDPTPSDLAESLPFLSACFSEALRLSPPGSATIREAASDLTIHGFAVPKGTPIHNAVFTAQRDPALWGPDADAFVPDRWLAGGGGGKAAGAPTPDLLAFGGGSLMCVGQRFALEEAKMTLVRLAARGLSFDLSPGQVPLAMHAPLTYGPAKGVFVTPRLDEGRAAADAAARRAGTPAMSTPLPLPAGGGGPPPTARAVGCVRARARVRRAGRSLPGLLSLSLSLSLSLHLSLSLSPALTHRPPTAACHPTGRRWTAAMGPGGRGVPCAAPCATVVGAHCIFLTKKKQFTNHPLPLTLLFCRPGRQAEHTKTGARAGRAGRGALAPSFFSLPPPLPPPAPPAPSAPPAPNPAPRGRGGRLPHPWRLSPPAAPSRPPARAALAWPLTPAEKGRPGRWARAFDTAAAGRPTGRARGQAAMATRAWGTLALDLTIR